MTTKRQRPAGEAGRRVARFGLCRAVAAALAVLGSLLLMLPSGALGRWAATLPLTWVACAAVLLTPGGERMAVRALRRFHRPGPGQAAALESTWATALRVTATAAADVELYVQTAPAPNAYAAGARSVAVTSRLVEDYQSGRLPGTQLVAVLVHEMGHHATGAARPMLAVSFLSAPWRWTMSLLTGLARMLAGRPHRRGLAIVVVPGLAVAVARALQQGEWMVGGVLLFVGLEAALCPLADAAISRQAEFAADRFAADHGLGLDLAAALVAMGDGRRAACGWSQRLTASHPTPEQRVQALLTMTARPRA
jgi:STE24 endopeptidase